MVKASSVLVPSLVVVWLTPLPVAQAPPPQEATKPDSPEVRQLLETVRQSAGNDWTDAFEFICAPNPNRANRPDDPEIEPTRVLDNLYVIGRSGTAVWVVTTPESIRRGTGVVPAVRERDVGLHQSAAGPAQERLMRRWHSSLAPARLQRVGGHFIFRSSGLQYKDARGRALCPELMYVATGRQGPTLGAGPSMC